MISLCRFIILPLIDYHIIKLRQNYKINYDTKITLFIVTIMRNQIKLICDIERFSDLEHFTSENRM